MSSTRRKKEPAISRVGKYMLLETLGQGAFGKVRLAVDERDGLQYAIKVMRKDVIKQQELTLQVRREIAVMKALRHPNIVNLHEVLSSKSNLYMVMDLVEGGELFDAVAERGKLSEDDARMYFQQLAEGISHCHLRRVYHRDIKPENLLLSQDKKTLKITDFGLSSIKGANSTTELLHTTMGSPHYIAPEIITSAAKGYEGAKVDVWASGVVLFGLLAGYLPFDEEKTKDLYRAIVQQPVKFPSHFSDGVKDLIGAMLAKDPERRVTFDEVKRFPWFRVNYIPLELSSKSSIPTEGGSRKKKRRGKGSARQERKSKRAARKSGSANHDGNKAGEKDLVPGKEIRNGSLNSLSSEVVSPAASPGSSLTDSRNHIEIQGGPDSSAAVTGAVPRIGANKVPPVCTENLVLSPQYPTKTGNKPQKLGLRLDEVSPQCVTQTSRLDSRESSEEPIATPKYGARARNGASKAALLERDTSEKDPVALPVTPKHGALDRAFKKDSLAPATPEQEGSAHGTSQKDPVRVSGTQRQEGLGDDTIEKDPSASPINHIQDGINCDIIDKDPGDTPLSTEEKLFFSSHPPPPPLPRGPSASDSLLDEEGSRGKITGAYSASTKDDLNDRDARRSKLDSVSDNSVATAPSGGSGAASEGSLSQQPSEVPANQARSTEAKTRSGLFERANLLFSLVARKITGVGRETPKDIPRIWALEEDENSDRMDENTQELHENENEASLRTDEIEQLESGGGSISLKSRSVDEERGQSWNLGETEAQQAKSGIDPSASSSSIEPNDFSQKGLFKPVPAIFAPLVTQVSDDSLPPEDGTNDRSFTEGHVSQETGIGKPWSPSGSAQATTREGSDEGRGAYPGQSPLFQPQDGPLKGLELLYSPSGKSNFLMHRQLQRKLSKRFGISFSELGFSGGRGSRTS